MIHALLLAFSAVALGDTLPETTIEGYVAEHAALMAAFRNAVRHAAAADAKANDRAGVVLFLRADVLPHATAEERVLYPAVERLLGTRGSTTAKLVQDHQTIRQLADDLAAVCLRDEVGAFNQQVQTLAALLERHFAAEETTLLPVLRQKMKEEEVRQLFSRMQAANTQ